MAEILEVVDLEALRKEVREKYREVAEDPTAEYHFHTGRAHAVRLGYPATPLDQLPDYAAKLLPAWVILSFGADRSLVRGSSISDPEPVWTPSWQRSGWARKDA